MTLVFIQAKDVLLFRDGKPFSSGEDHAANSIFPPTPITVQGAMRAKISISLGVSLGEYRAKKEHLTDVAKTAHTYIGPPGSEIETGLFEMQGPFVGVCVEGVVHQVVPAPQDLYIHEDVKSKCKSMPPDAPLFQITKPGEGVISNLKPDMNLRFLETIPDYESMGGYWITAGVFNSYLQNKAPDNSAYGKQIVKSTDLYQREGRFGVATNSQTSFRREGQLYQAQFIRMYPGVGLLVNVNNIPDDKLLFGDMTIGGEQKQAIAQEVKKHSLINANPKTVSGKFKVILLTPAYFDGGWKPDDNFEELLGSDAKLIGAALDRPQRIGGWSNNANTARAMHNYVSPGSVYYFDAGDKTITVPDIFTQTPPGIDNAGKIGFGQFAITDRI